MTGFNIKGFRFVDRTKHSRAGIICTISVLAVVLAMLLWGNTVSVAEEQPGQLIHGDYKLQILKDNTVRIDEWTGSDRVLSVPSIIDGYTVVQIGPRAFRESDTLEEIILPEGLLSVGYKAFSRCKSLTKVVFPHSLANWSPFSFDDCESLSHLILSDKAIAYLGFGGLNDIPSLKTVELPEGTEVIPEKLFNYCTNLERIIIPESVREIGENAFRSCKSLEIINIPNGISEIKDSTFSGCEKLSGLKLPDTIVSIGDSAFRDCSSLTDIQIPDSVTVIGSYAFSDCWSLKTLMLPDSIAEIKEYAFNDCTGLRDLVIPGSVETIGDGAFWGCSRLDNVIIQEGVLSIGQAAFCDCSSLYSISVPSSVKSIGDIAFYYNQYRTVTVSTPAGSYAERYARKEFYLTYDNHYVEADIMYAAQKPDYSTALQYGPYFYAVQEDDTAILIRYAGNESSLQIPEVIDGHTVSAIGDGAFDSYERLSGVMIPETIVKIGKNPFSACPELAVIKVSASNPVLAVIDNVLFRKEDKCLITYPAGSGDAEYSIPQGIRRIGDYAFYSCFSLKNISVPDSVSSIGEKAFMRCRGLKKLVLPESITDIGEKAFLKVADGIEITVHQDSYAESYCRKNNLLYVYPDSTDWLND